MEFYANCHLHSLHSDGIYTPTELARLARAEGYGAAALTDHDTMTGCAEMERACREQGLEFLTGCEFTVLEPESLHMTAFSFDPEYPRMKEYLSHMARRQTHNTEVVFGWAVERGGITGITWDEVLEYNEGVSWLCNTHVFRAMKAKGLIDTPQYQAFFDANFRDQRALVPPSFAPLPAKDMIALVHAAGGFIILAHPVAPYGSIKSAEGLLEAGLDGIEVWHHELDEEARQHTHEFAVKNGLLISGGSDHAGLCGGYYDTFASEEELKKSYLYIQPHSTGTTREHFEEMKARGHR